MFAWSIYCRIDNHISLIQHFEHKSEAKRALKKFQQNAPSKDRQYFLRPFQELNIPS